jgi:hypothetical protein
MTAVSSPAQVPRRSASAATASSMRDSTTCRRLTLPQGEGRSWFMDGRTAEPGREERAHNEHAGHYPVLCQARAGWRCR